MNRYLMVDAVEDLVAEVELDGGLRTELPAEWLPNAAEGAGYRIEVQPGGLRFVPDSQAARVIRERNKQTLLDFSDEAQ